jgi:hypothetical protein
MLKSVLNITLKNGSHVAKHLSQYSLCRCGGLWPSPKTDSRSADLAAYVSEQMSAFRAATGVPRKVQIRRS